MIKIFGKIPMEIAIAVSGGADSMACLDFLRRTRDVVVLHYNHGTKYAPIAEQCVKEYCAKHDLNLVIGRCEEEMPKGVSAEAWWRDRRYEFFNEATSRKIVMAHHLDDVVENWVFTSMNGNPSMIPRVRGNYLRPFLCTRKQDFVDWCERFSVPVVEDPSNSDTKYRRNYIRHELMPHILQINPGIHKTIKKKIMNYE